MPKRSSKIPPSDPNEAAALTVARLTGTLPVVPEKNAAAVALGRLGGQKGGKARAAKLTPEQRSAISRKAAETRWKKE